jgi:hypothetical protein
MLCDFLFEYTAPSGAVYPLAMGVFRDPETGLEEPVFPFAHITACLGYLHAPSVKLTCHERHLRRASFLDFGGGRAVKAVTREGLFLATPISDTPQADHFHAWIRAVVTAYIDRPMDPGGENNTARVTELEVIYLHAELEKLHKRLDAAQAYLAPLRTSDAPGFDPLADPPPYVPKIYGQPLDTPEKVQAAIEDALRV